MSANPYFFIEKKNEKTGKWEQIKVFRQNENGKFVYCDVWPWNGAHELFGMLEAESSYEDHRVSGVRWGIPADVSDGIKNEYSIFKEDGVRPHYVYLADLYIDILENPKVVDYDAMDEAYANAGDGEKVEKIYCDTPIKDFYETICSYIGVWDDFYSSSEYRCQIRIIYWLSW